LVSRDLGHVTEEAGDNRFLFKFAKNGTTKYGFLLSKASNGTAGQVPLFIFISVRDLV
jgi:hypothetical protein